MNFPAPATGMVIAYSFLWVNEAHEGPAQGRKYELQLRKLRAPGAKSGGISSEAFGCTENRGRIAPEDWPPTRRKGAEGAVFLVDDAHRYFNRNLHAIFHPATAHALSVSRAASSIYDE